jgi:hypothetical protein
MKPIVSKKMIKSRTDLKIVFYLMKQAIQTNMKGRRLLRIGR